VKEVEDENALKHMFDKAHLKRTADALVAGHLDASRNIENLGLLVGQLAYGLGFGNRVTLRACVA
jgi:hypothetical protein